MPTATPTTTPAKPVKLPRPRNVIESRIAQRLVGFTLSDAWLVETPFAELDDLRADHHRLLGQLTTNVDALRDLTAQHAREDAEYRDALIAAARAGKPAPADERTVPADRGAAIDAAQDRTWATAQALAEVADAIVTTARENEDAWLDQIGDDAHQALDQENEALRMLREARGQRVRAGLRARWTMTLADDHGNLSRQPWPGDDAPIPPSANPDALKLRRHWAEARDWSTPDPNEGPA